MKYLLFDPKTNETVGVDYEWTDAQDVAREFVQYHGYSLVIQSMQEKDVTDECGDMCSCGFADTDQANSVVLIDDKPESLE